MNYGAFKTYGPHPHSHRSRRVHRARPVRRSLGLASLVMAAIWVPPAFLVGFAVGAALLRFAGMPL